MSTYILLVNRPNEIRIHGSIGHVLLKKQGIRMCKVDNEMIDFAPVLAWWCVSNYPLTKPFYFGDDRQKIHVFNVLFIYCLYIMPNFHLLPTSHLFAHTEYYEMYQFITYFAIKASNYFTRSTWKSGVSSGVPLEVSLGSLNKSSNSYFWELTWSSLWESCSSFFFSCKTPPGLLVRIPSGFFLGILQHFFLGILQEFLEKSLKTNFGIPD